MKFLANLIRDSISLVWHNKALWFVSVLMVSSKAIIGRFSALPPWIVLFLQIMVLGWTVSQFFYLIEVVKRQPNDWWAFPKRTIQSYGYLLPLLLIGFLLMIVPAAIWIAFFINWFKATYASVLEVDVTNLDPQDILRLYGTADILQEFVRGSWRSELLLRMVKLIVDYLVFSLFMVVIIRIEDRLNLREGVKKYWQFFRKKRWVFLLFLILQILHRWLGSLGFVSIRSVAFLLGFEGLYNVWFSLYMVFRGFIALIPNLVLVLCYLQYKKGRLALVKKRSAQTKKRKKR